MVGLRCLTSSTRNGPASPRRAVQGPAYGDLSKDPGTGDGWNPNIGRFPANLALVHDEECVRVGTVKVKATSSGLGGGTRPGHFVDVGSKSGNGSQVSPGYADADGTETVDEWRCTDTCAVRVLGEQSGDLPSQQTRNVTRSRENHGAFGLLKRTGSNGTEYLGETGTAARFFYQAKASANDRLAYLTCSPTCTENDTVAPVKNVTGKVCPVCNTPRTDYQHPTVKPYDLALYHAKLLSLPPHTSPVAIVPFCGTGVEARALMDVGYRVIAVDIDPRHVAMTRYRLSGEQPVREAPVTVAQESTPASPVAPITLDDLFGF